MNTHLQHLKECPLLSVTFKGTTTFSLQHLKELTLSLYHLKELPILHILLVCKI